MMIDNTSHMSTTGLLSGVLRTAKIIIRMTDTGQYTYTYRTESVQDQVTLS